MQKLSAGLLAEIDPLPFKQRVHRVAEWARAAANRAEVCAELRGGGPYERELALVAAIAARDPDGVTAALADPDPALRSRARVAAFELGVLDLSDTDLAAAERKQLIGAVRRGRRPGAAEQLLTAYREKFGDEVAARLLPVCGDQAVRRLLPELAHLTNVKVVALRHPGPLLDWFTGELADVPEVRRVQLWRRYGHAVLRCPPGQALGLLERYGPREELPGSLWQYNALDPARVARLLAAPDRAAWLRRTYLPHSLLVHLRSLPDAGLEPIGRRLRDLPRQLSALLRALPPARRGALYDLIHDDTDTRTLIPGPKTLDLLPYAVRVREATRILTLPEVSRDEPAVRRWSAYLPWPAASAAVESALRSGNADERADGWTRLIEAALRARDPLVLAGAIERMRRLRNEQDPVRRAAIHALSPAAPLLTAAAVPALTAVTEDAVDTRDQSTATLAALGRLANEVLRHHVDDPELSEWALLTIDLLTAKAARPTLPSFRGALRRGQERDVFERLRPWIAAGLERGVPFRLFAVTSALGERAYLLPELQDLLASVVFGRFPDARISEAIGLWLQDPRARNERVGRLLTWDSSVITIWTVWDTVQWFRTDLLDHVLKRRPRGRFLSPDVRWVPGQARAPRRWLPRQQGRYAGLQQLVIADEGAHRAARASAIAACARIPGGVGFEVARRYATGPDVMLVESALAALAYTDRPEEALPILLAHAGDDRARVALYAAGHAVRYVRPSRLTALFEPIITGAAKVTSKKAAIRMLAEGGPVGVLGVLRQAYGNEGVHRDVRAAIVAAARERLWDPQAWELLERALGGSREEARAVIAIDPSRIAGDVRPRYASLIAQSCGAADRAVREETYAVLPRWRWWLSGETGALLAGRLTDLGETAPSQDLVAAAGPQVLITAFDRLAARDTGDDLPGGPGHDRPARRRIANLAATLARLRPEAAPAARHLAGLPGYERAGLTALVGICDLAELPAIAARCADRPLLGAYLADRAAARIRSRPQELTPALLPLAAQLAADGSVAGGMVALALVRLAGTWTEPWRDALLELRRHAAPEVREAALEMDMT